jgi:hypothetical protein
VKIPERLADAILHACDESAEEIQRLVLKLDSPLELDSLEVSAVIFKHMRVRIGSVPNERAKS